jgi:hypothetical protein
MARKKPIISPFGQWAYPGEVTIIPSSDITMKGVNYPVLGIDNLGNQQMMMPGGEYTFPGNYVTEIPQMGKGGLRQWFAEEWTDVKTGKPCGRSGKDKDGRPYPACRPSKRVNETTPKTTSEMSSAEKAKFKREKTSDKRIDYNHKRREFGGENWLDQFDVGGEKSFWDKYKYLPSSKSPNTYEKVNVDKDHYAFNSSLGNKGDLKVQQYQKWLNENFNTYLDEDGIWGEKTENAYKKYVLEKQKPNIPNTDPGLLNNYDSKLSFKYDDKGNLQVKSGNKYEEDYQDWTNVEKLSPTLKEFKSLVDKIPSYNQYYEDVYDADPSLRGNQAGPVTQTRALQIENTKKYKPISDKNKEYIGKTFGTLPVVEVSGIYEGYSPNRIWTTPPATDSKPWLGDNEKYDPEKNPRYLYFITPKEGTKSADKKFTEQLEDLNCASGVCGDEYLNKSKTTYFDDISNQRFKKALKVKETIPGPTGETWKLGQQAYIEMLNNPEIIEYAKQKNIDLKNLSPKEAYSPLLAEALVANRDARFNNKDVVIPDSRYYSTVIQNPDAFNLAGYLPITLDMFSPNTDIQAQQKLLLNWDKASRESYLEKAGIPKDKWNDVYIHTSSFPIEEYTPGKKYGGWLDQYQDGSQVPFSDSSNYSYDKDGNLIYTADWRNYTNDIITNNIYSLINNPTKENSVIKKGFFRQGQPNSKSRDLNNDEIEFLKRTLQQFEDPEADFKGDVSTKVDKLNPSLDELIKVTQNIYPDQYAIDNSFLKASKSDSKINLPISAFENDIKERYVIPEVLKNSINKSFGTLPTTQEEGYSPNRIWTTKVKNNEKSGVGAGFTKPGDYAYVLTPNSKEISGLSKDQIDNQKKITERSLSSINDEFYKNLYDEGRGFVQYPGDYNNPDISLYGNLTQYLPNQIWNRAEQMRVEMMNNPEIKAWSDLHNINLLRDTSNEINKNDLTDDGFAVKVPESMYANRLVKAGLPVSTPDYNYGDNDTYIAQDPSKFNLAGYFPIPEGYNDENAKELIAKKLGIKPEQLNSKDYLIHYNKTPITEYTPGKKYGGWLDQFQTGGWANFVPASSTPLLRKDVSGNAGYRDNTRVNTINPATKKAAEAAQYARRVGSISQGKTKSDYEKAREASSFVSQAEQRKGSADPLDYVLDIVNPATYGFAGTDLVGNTAMGVNNLAKGNFSEAAGNALNAGMNALYLAPAVAELRGPLNTLSNSIYKGIPKAFLNKSEAELQKQAGVDWLRNWYSQPEIKQRFNQQIYNPAVADDLIMPIYKKNVVTDVIEKPNSTINLNKSAASDFASGMSKEKYAELKYGFRKDPIVSLKYNEEIPFAHKKYLGVNSGYGNNMGGYTNVYPEHPEFFYSKFNPFSNWKPTVKGTTIHEGTHWLTTGDQGLAESTKQMFREPFDISKRISKHDKYLTKPTEVHARLNELRSQYNLGPTVTQSQVDKIISDGLKGKTNVQSRFFELLKDNKSLTNLFNTAMGISAPIATASQLQEQKQGGQTNWLNKYK